ncbi:Mur ligase family protein [Haloplasma contractile]|uniref:UDP-N-acetylmuramoylalanyl-D-glutamyl-2 6-diaminopimelate--D-alanyl-D-alanine ligase protein n=1 Tax=Haloplasma contractile SSD-17B TaxID=1033810 RepID=U2FDR6_9MOLU|nr:UDP-N-acetylmuramoyl-tripeptide--D-alanyl-D-alanine ligase [Haloplasma contractile]ERJ11125.1 UDP-N-acetylmuramoylalanyl-D-glutamyl-2 6-diaminopimelate--D-alanyl-D-alanine ligase protein [Haloplasma contractile SSD-17B]
MKMIDLKDIIKLFKIDTYKEVKHVSFTNVTNNIKKINNDTLVFHIYKKDELNVEEYNNLSNCYIVTDQPILKSQSIVSGNILYVTNVKKAYSTFINYYRALFDIPVVAITGTCGKTTTKEMIKHVLENKYKVAATKSSRNSLEFNLEYLLSIDEETEFGVFETGVSYPGNLILGCEYFKPTIGVITNIGMDHLSGCKTFENYMRTKGEMLAGLGYEGTLIINNDDTNIKQLDFSPYEGTIITFGIMDQANFFADQIKYEDEGMSFCLHYDSKAYEAYAPGFGEHNVYNALAALSVLDTLGIDLEESIEYLSSFKHIRSHLQFHNGINNSIIVDDTWSSNPPSMKAAFEVLSNKGKEKVKIVVLGKLPSQGDYAIEHYKQIAQLIIDYKIDFLITKSSITNNVSKKVEELGMNEDRIIHCKNNTQVKSALEGLLDANSIVLFKKSMFDQSITKIMNKYISD